MSSAKLFGCAINVEAEQEGGGGSSIALEVPRSGIQQDFNPFYHFLDSNSDSGSVSMEAEPEFIDFFDRESYEIDMGREFRIGSNQRVSSSFGGFNIWEEDIELGLGIGSGSGPGDSGGLVVHREIDSGRVEVGTRVEYNNNNNLSEEAMVLDEEFEWENLHNAIDWVQEPVQVSSSPSMDDAWQLLWDANSFFEDMMDLDLGVYLANSYEDGETNGEYDAVLARMFDNEDGVVGSPPASKRVVDDLPAVVITSEQVSNGNTIVCAICKDDIVVEEKAKRLPCKHFYHGDCIVPWLGIRNTCPVCRYELPTDDVEYERTRRSQRRGSSGLAMESMSG
ncbi:hypothetical protein CARUB_v10001383mg [Capsella rubella]|uniref:RING-type E3 ubiquitin transferase n=1 Tax=Capsella rubella TaxID=81985 RepID=R0GVX9_9BRAS|nr:E3 ubiquitin-protein ligase CIP8 [Capsella rubella]EOA21044.1 hypothetical protein CARUB_v10001383mg [Capsella rubella]